MIRTAKNSMTFSYSTHRVCCPDSTIFLTSLKISSKVLPVDVVVIVVEEVVVDVVVVVVDVVVMVVDVVVDVVLDCLAPAT